LRPSLPLALCLAACTRTAPPASVATPREALAQLALCALDRADPDPDPDRFEGSLRQLLRADRERFATRAGACETALETPGGRHPCLARLRTRWAALLTVVQRPGVDAIDQDVAIRRAGEAWADAAARCPR
jgi:hypothetical protein